jgi:hypothetical protein
VLLFGYYFGFNLLEDRMDVALLLLDLGSSFGSDHFRFLVGRFLFLYSGFLDDGCLLSCLELLL